MVSENDSNDSAPKKDQQPSEAELDATIKIPLSSDNKAGDPHATQKDSEADDTVGIDSAATMKLPPPSSRHDDKTVASEGQGAPAAEPKRPGLRVGNYEIVKELGRGGMAVVYEALQPGLNRTVALKVLPFQYANDTEFLKRFYREAQSAAALSHPNIVGIHDVGEDHGTHYFVMDLIRGPTLAEEMKKEKIPLKRALDIFLQAAEAVEYAHENDIIHRDLKPGNVMLDENDRAFVTDFGLAKPKDTEKLTVTGAVMGTPAFMSPEQAAGKSADRRSDIYSLGVVLYELVTTVIPFTAPTQAQMIKKVIEKEPPRPGSIHRNLHKNLEAIILKAMEKRPKDRYQTVGELIADIQAFQRNEPVSARIPTMFERGDRFMRRHKALMVSVSVILLVVGLTYRWVHQYLWKVAGEQAVINVSQLSQTRAALRPRALLPGAERLLESDGTLKGFNEQFLNEEYDAAIKSYRNIIPRFRGERAAAIAQHNIGLAYEMKKQYAEAIKAYRKTASFRDYADVAALANCGIAYCHIKSNRVEEAEKLLATIDIKIAEESSLRLLGDLHHMLAQSAWTSKESQRAISHYRRALLAAKRRDSSRAASSHQLQIARILAEDVRFAEAIAEYKTLLNDFPDETFNTAWAMLEMGEIYVELNNPFKAKAIWTRLLEEYPLAEDPSEENLWRLPKEIHDILLDRSHELPRSDYLPRITSVATYYQNDIAFCAASKLRMEGKTEEAREWYRECMKLSANEEWPYRLVERHVSAAD